MRRRIRPCPPRGLFLAGTVTGVVACLLTASCGGAGTASGSSSGRVSVVAAENFYGNIATQLGGRYVVVTSILSNPNADPHLFEPGTAVAAQIATARLVVENGLAYDTFVDRLLAAAPGANRTVVKISEVLHVSGPYVNPHLWYDVPKVPVIAHAIAQGLVDVAPSHRAYFEGRLGAFDRSLRPLDEAVAGIRAKYVGTPVAYTEPVPGYMLQAAGLTVLTPPSFARAIEEGNEPSAQDVAAMEALLAKRRVRVLLYNSQATSPITNLMRSIASQHGIAIVPISETLPAGKSFQQWQIEQVLALGNALQG